MPTTDEDRMLHVLAEDECRQLFSSSAIGRLAYTDGALPAIVPVSYAVHDGKVIIPAKRGSDIAAAVRGAVVAVQADSWDPGTREGWSVTVVGPTRIVSSPLDALELDRLGVFSRPSSADRCYITVSMELLRGWRMSPRRGGADEDGPAIEATRTFTTDP